MMMKTVWKRNLAARLENIWYKDAKPPWPLRLLGGAYGVAAQLRRALYPHIFKPADAGVPVLSLGNLSVGGTGKTPLCLNLAGELLKRGYRPAILSRGYGRQKGGPQTLVVSRGKGPEVNPHEAGDEPWLMAKTLPEALVMVDACRARGAKAAVEKLGADFLIMDDGFQHLALKADIKTLLLPAGQPFGNGFCLPAGPLREPVSAHKAADILIVTGAEDVPEPLADLAAGRPLFTAIYRPKGFRPLAGGSLIAPSNFSGRKVMAFCGLGRPAGFLRTLNNLGLQVLHFTARGDHQPYNKVDLDELGLKFMATGAEFMVTTAKDAVKLPRRFPLPVFVLEVDLALNRPDDFMKVMFSLCP